MRCLEKLEDPVCNPLDGLVAAVAVRKIEAVLLCVVPGRDPPVCSRDCIASFLYKSRVGSIVTPLAVSLDRRTKTDSVMLPGVEHRTISSSSLSSS